VVAKGEPDRIDGFVGTYLDRQFVWEDPAERLEGIKEFSDLLYLSKYVKALDFELIVLKI